MHRNKCTGCLAPGAAGCRLILRFWLRESVLSYVGGQGNADPDRLRWLVHHVRDSRPRGVGLRLAQPNLRRLVDRQGGGIGVATRREHGVSTLEYKRSSGACKEPRRMDKQSASTFDGGDGGCAIAYPPYVLGSGAVLQYRWTAGMSCACCIALFGTLERPKLRSHAGAWER